MSMNNHLMSSSLESLNSLSKSVAKTTSKHNSTNDSANSEYHSVNDESTFEHNMDGHREDISAHEMQSESQIPANIPNIMRRMRRSSGYHNTHQNSDDSNDSHNSTANSRPHSLREQSGKVSVSLDESNTQANANHSSNQSYTSFASASTATPHMIDRMRRKLRYAFMNPIDKWRAKKRFPFKLLVQLFKIIFVTYQLINFGFDMSRYMSNEGNMIVSFREIFLENWDAVREVMTYPPAAGPYAVYTKDDFYASIDYSIRQYSNITELSVGTYGYAANITERNMSDIWLCRKRYSNGTAKPSDYVYVYDNNIVDECLTIGEIYPPGDVRWFTDFNTLNYLKAHNSSINFDRLIDVELVLPLRTIYLNSLAKYDAPKCFDVNVTILFDNHQHDGQILVSLNVNLLRHSCNGDLQISSDSEGQIIKRQSINWLVIIFCLISCVLCVRSVYRMQKLRFETQTFFSKHFGKSLSFEDKMDFIDLWIVLIIVNDLMILFGSTIKMQMETDNIENNYYITCSILLGVGNLFVWAGLLRYLEFFHQYNILILTLRRAIPHVLRFGLCAILLYGGFCCLGWVVLGPYHLKFRTLSRTSECLFSLMNGDDMFATFYITESGQRLAIWWFSRFYFYIFICLFIYLVLSLFIAIIMDSYETIKEYYEYGMPLTGLKKFISECTDESTSKAFIRDRDRSIANIFNSCYKCCRRTSLSYDSM